MTKAERIRRLHSFGVFSPKAIARYVGVSHVHACVEINRSLSRPFERPRGRPREAHCDAMFHAYQQGVPISTIAKTFDVDVQVVQSAIKVRKGG